MDRRYLSFRRDACPDSSLPNPGGLGGGVRADPAADGVESCFPAGANRRLDGGSAPGGRRLVRRGKSSANALGGTMGYDSPRGVRSTGAAGLLLRFRIGGI